LWELVEDLEANRAARADDAPTARMEIGAVAHQDHLVDLLTVPIRDLKAPLAVASSVLAGDTIYLCANDHQAASVRATGGIPYTPQEIDILWEMHQAVQPEVWAERLRLIHEAKKRFQGRLEP